MEHNEETAKVIARIRKMLAMANDKANVNESAVAASMAEKLMRKYQLDMMDIMPPEQLYGAKDINSEYQWTGGKAAPWMEWVAVSVARLNECEVKYDGYKMAMGFQFVGVGPDPTVAAEIYKYLVGEINRLAKNVQGRAAINSFKKGAGHEVSQRVRELARQRKADFESKSTGTALVIHKAALIAQSHGEFQYGKSKKATASDWDAYYQGRRAGAGINLQDQVGQDKRGALE